MKDTIEAAIILVIIAIPLMIMSYLFYKTKMKELEQKIDNSEKVQINNELTSLKHRVMILEKIVTDKGYQVDDEIEKLKSVK